MIAVWIYYVPTYIGEQKVTHHTYIVVDKIVETTAFGSLYGVVLKSDDGEVTVKQGIDVYYQYPPKGTKWQIDSHEGTLLSFLSAIYSAIMIFFTLYIITEIIDRVRYKQ